MKVLIVSEGRSEHLSATSSHPRADDEVTGALRRLVCRINEHSTGWEITEDKLSSQYVRAHHGKGKGYEKRCVRWMLEAEKRGFDAIVLLMDRDRVDSRIPEVDLAQAISLAAIRRALGVAVESFEAWMLADQVALSQVLGNTVQRQSDPESNSNPKESFRRLFQATQRECSISEDFAEICAVTTVRL